MPVYMRVKINAFFFNLAQLGQGKHLKSAGIRENRSVPAHEFVKSAKFFDQLIPCAHMEMVGVGQFHLSADLPKVIG